MAIKGAYVRSWHSVTSQSRFFKKKGLNTHPVWVNVRRRCFGINQCITLIVSHSEVAVHG